MAITKEAEIAKIEIVGAYKHVQVRTDTVIKEDGAEISRSAHRHVLECGTLNASDALVDNDISGEATEVQAVANAVWTDAVKDAWTAKLASETV